MELNTQLSTFTSGIWRTKYALQVTLPNAGTPINVLISINQTLQGTTVNPITNLPELFVFVEYVTPQVPNQTYITRPKQFIKIPIYLLDFVGMSQANTMPTQQQSQTTPTPTPSPTPTPTPTPTPVPTTTPITTPISAVPVQVPTTTPRPMGAGFFRTLFGNRPKGFAGEE
jgi:hypothetical protein